jgi:antibiotic biosynthesis monooxygenase (ABM) superfamily enzyme
MEAAEAIKIKKERSAKMVQEANTQPRQPVQGWKIAIFISMVLFIMLVGFVLFWILKKKK